MCTVLNRCLSVCIVTLYKIKFLLCNVCLGNLEPNFGNDRHHHCSLNFEQCICCPPTFFSFKPLESRHELRWLCLMLCPLMMIVTQGWTHPQEKYVCSISLYKTVLRPGGGGGGGGILILFVWCRLKYR